MDTERDVTFALRLQKRVLFGRLLALKQTARRVAANAAVARRRQAVKPLSSAVAAPFEDTAPSICGRQFSVLVQLSLACLLESLRDAVVSTP